MSKKKHKIVIIDDDEDLLKLISYELKKEGFDVKTFLNGKEALAFLLEKENYEQLSLVITDRILPDMDGVAIIKQLTQKFNHMIPLLILSVLSSERDVITGLKVGAIDYITKPFSLPVFIEKVNRLVQ